MGKITGGKPDIFPIMFSKSLYYNALPLNY